MRGLEKLPELKHGQVTVWFACVDRPQPGIQEFAAVLSREETARAQRFRSAQDRDRYIVFHGVLRSLLAAYLGCGPRQVDICKGAHGKPCLAGTDCVGALQFNLSHSGAYAAFAFGRNSSIGVDIEEVREIQEMEGIVAQHFTRREKDALLSCPKDRREEMFYRFWSRKEAVLKAQGEGLLRELDSVDVATGEGTGPWLVKVVGEGSVEEYLLFDVDTYKGFSASAAVALYGSLNNFLLSVNFI